jgi:hypothetical protein
VTGELDPWRLNLQTKCGREEMGCGVGDPPNTKTIKKKKKKNSESYFKVTPKEKLVNLALLPKKLMRTKHLELT